MEQQNKFLAEIINEKLGGGVITGAILSSDSESVGFNVRRDGKTTAVWIDCDPEGNHAGFLSVE